MELSHISPPDRLGELQIALEQAKLYEMKIKNFILPMSDEWSNSFFMNISNDLHMSFYGTSWEWIAFTEGVARFIRSNCKLHSLLFSP